MNHCRAKIVVCIIAQAVIIFFGSGQQAFAEIFADCDFNSPPSSESQGGAYSCAIGSLSLFFGSNLSGNVFDHISTGGWNNSGAAKFYSHIAAESYGNSYRQLNPGAYSSPVRQNLRYLLKLGTGSASEIGGKWHLTDASGGWRTWIAPVGHGGALSQVQPEIAYNNTIWMAHGDGATASFCSSNGYQCCRYPDTWWDNTVTSCAQTVATPFYYIDYEDQWACLEIERHRTGEYKIYIWTGDGRYGGLNYWLDTTMDQNLGNTPIGGYLDGNYTGRYFIIDEVKIADSFIGPPAGFTGGGTTVRRGDLNADGRIDVTDLGILLSNWSATTRPASDLNQDGRVDVTDLGVLLGNWG